MKLFKLLIGCLLVSVQVGWASTEITITRTYNGIAHEQNQLVMNLSGSDLEVRYPFGHRLYGKFHQFSVENKKVSQFLAQDKNVLSTYGLKKQLNVIHARHDLPLFYSSENDEFLIQQWDDHVIVWELRFNNWQELQNRYQWLRPEWQSLVDWLYMLTQEQVFQANKKIVEAEQ